MTGVGIASQTVRRATTWAYRAIGAVGTIFGGVVAIYVIAKWKPSATYFAVYCFVTILLLSLLSLPWWLLVRSNRRLVDLETRLAIPSPKVRSFQSPRRRKNRTEVVTKGLASATRTIDACGIANEMITTDLPAEFLRAFFENGGRLRALFIDPTPGGIADEREVAEGHAPRTDTLAVKSARNIRRLLGLQTLIADLRIQWRDYDGTSPQPSLEIRTYKTPPKANILIVDAGWALVHYYGEATAGTASPVVEVDTRLLIPEQSTPESQIQADRAKHRNRDALNFYVQEFEALWEKASPLPEPIPEVWS